MRLTVFRFYYSAGHISSLQAQGSDSTWDRERTLNMDTVQRADERKASKPNEIKYTQNDSEEELEPPSPIHISSEAALTPDFDFSDPHELRRIESDTQKRLKAILEVAGVTGLSQIDARTFQDPEILRKLTNRLAGGKLGHMMHAWRELSWKRYIVSTWFFFFLSAVFESSAWSGKKKKQPNV